MWPDICGRWLGGLAPPNRRRAAADGPRLIAPAGMPLHDALVTCGKHNVPVEALGTFFGPKGAPVVKSPQADRVFPDFTFGTHLCDLEVDLDTGQVKLLGYVAAHDIGRAINPRSVQGQIAGAVAQGLGMALLEEVLIADGVNLTAGLYQYLISTATDMPEVNAMVPESGEGMGPFGARGIGSRRSAADRGRGQRHPGRHWSQARQPADDPRTSARLPQQPEAGRTAIGGSPLPPGLEPLTESMRSGQLAAGIRLAKPAVGT